MTTISKVLRTAAVASTLIMLAAMPASAADAIVQFDLQKAMNAPDTLAHIDGSVKFYFGSTSHPAIIKHLGEGIANKRANGFGRESTRGCERAFLDALITMQDKAKELGANAVINVNSYFKRNEVPITTTVECHSGMWMDAVTLKGEFVKVK